MLRSHRLTDTAGEYRFAGLPTGNCSLRIGTTGFQSQVRSVNCETPGLRTATSPSMHSPFSIVDPVISILGPEDRLELTTRGSSRKRAATSGTPCASTRRRAWPFGAFSGGGRHISQRLLAAQKRAIRHIEDPARVRTHTKSDMIQWNLSNLDQNSQRIPLYAVAKQQAISGLVVQSFSSPRALDGTSKRVRDSRRGGLGLTSAATCLFLRGSPGGDGQPDIDGRVFMQG